jgi:hypothetical protein
MEIKLKKAIFRKVGYAVHKKKWVIHYEKKIN